MANDCKRLRTYDVSTVVPLGDKVQVQYEDPNCSRNNNNPWTRFPCEVDVRRPKAPSIMIVPTFGSMLGYSGINVDAMELLRANWVSQTAGALVMKAYIQDCRLLTFKPDAKC